MFEAKENIRRGEKEKRKKGEIGWFFFSSVPFLLSAASFVFFSPTAAEPQLTNDKQLTWPGLLQEAADLISLTELSALPFTSHQVSSYDRRSLTPNDPEGWFANEDRGHCLYEGAVQKETPFYRTNPQQARAADGAFPAGTKVGIARHRSVVGYVWAYATNMDGKPLKRPLQGFIARDSFTPNPAGPVLADIQGPGCITRFWSSNPSEAGMVRIFLDNVEKPIIETRLESLLTLGWPAVAGGREIPPLHPPLVGEHARGCILLFPITFAKHCLITVEKPDVQYQINYRKYAPGTAVQPFRFDDLIEQRAFLQRLQTNLKTSKPFDLLKLANQLSASLPRKEGARGKEAETPDIKRASLAEPTIAPGEKRRIDLIEPPGTSSSRAIIQLHCQVQAERLQDALRMTLLTITFDGSASPQVRVPLGDFFGTAPGANTMTTLPTHTSAAGELTSHWILPYAASARLELANLGNQPVTVQMELVHVPRPWTSRSLHFHASWRFATLPTRPYRDWTVAKMTGQGHYVGTMLSVNNPVKGWWGEGDSKIWIDDEAFPSHWGTGTDDDFGCGWADQTLFSQPWHAQSRVDGNEHQGYTSLFRCRMLDRIPFNNSLHYALEVRHGQPGNTVQYAATAYWYARPGAEEDAPDITADLLQRSLAGASQ